MSDGAVVVVMAAALWQCSNSVVADRAEREA